MINEETFCHLDSLRDRGNSICQIQPYRNLAMAYLHNNYWCSGQCTSPWVSFLYSTSFRKLDLPTSSGLKGGKETQSGGLF
jgi:hypothetical protein